LNLVARMSGIATATRTLQDLLAGAGGRGKVAGTRKTTPGFRAFEKEAIRAGGGDPHRMGLFDEAMVKDNHREALGGDVAAAVRRVRAAHPGVPVTCEVESQADALTAAEAGADWILIDNQAPETGRAWAEAVRAKHPRVRIEASGGIGPHDVAAYAWADRVSMGWLTQRAPARDFGLDWLPTEGKQHT
jgi:nicotinate-nucleotide pyrophosphorylase (carboxylating)